VGHAFERKTGDGTGAIVHNTSGTLRGCFAPVQRKISLPICGLFEMGGTTASGSGPGVTPSKATSLWIATGLGAGIEYAPIPRLALVANVDALVALYRPRFHVQLANGTAEEVFRVAPAGVRLVLGLACSTPKTARRRSSMHGRAHSRARSPSRSSPCDRGRGRSSTITASARCGRSRWRVRRATTMRRTSR
jgi:hypothetical protein